MYGPAGVVTDMGLKSRHSNFSQDELQERFDAAYAANISSLVIWVNQEPVKTNWLPFLEAFRKNTSSANAPAKPARVVFETPKMIGTAGVTEETGSRILCSCNFAADVVHNKTECKRMPGVPWINKSTYSACASGCSSFFVITT